MMGFLKDIDWTATGVLVISLWQAIKEWRTRSVTRAEKKPKMPPKVR